MKNERPPIVAKKRKIVDPNAEIVDAPKAVVANVTEIAPNAHPECVVILKLVRIVNLYFVL
jgi:hypothetical protein